MRIYFTQPFILTIPQKVTNTALYSNTRETIMRISKIMNFSNMFIMEHFISKII